MPTPPPLRFTSDTKRFRASLRRGEAVPSFLLENGDAPFPPRFPAGRPASIDEAKSTAVGSDRAKLRRLHHRAHVCMYKYAGERAVVNAAWFRSRTSPARLPAPPQRASKGASVPVPPTRCCLALSCTAVLVLPLQPPPPAELQPSRRGIGGGKAPRGKRGARQKQTQSGRPFLPAAIYTRTSNPPPTPRSPPALHFKQNKPALKAKHLLVTRCSTTRTGRSNERTFDDIPRSPPRRRRRPAPRAGRFVRGRDGITPVVASATAAAAAARGSLWATPRVRPGGNA